MREKKDQRIEIRLTKAEKESLVKRIKVTEDVNSIAQLIRKKMFGELAVTTYTITHAVDPDLLAQVTKIGNNINQLTRHVNTCTKIGEAYSAIELYELLSYINDALTKLLKIKSTEDAK